MALNIPNIVGTGNIFKASSGDGEKIIISGGEEVPEDVEKDIIMEEFNNSNLGNWTIAATGSASSAVVNGILTLQTGNTDESQITLIHKGIKSFSNFKKIFMEVRFKLTETNEPESAFGIGISDGISIDSDGFPNNNQNALYFTTNNMSGANACEYVETNVGSASGGDIDGSRADPEQWALGTIMAERSLGGNWTLGTSNFKTYGSGNVTADIPTNTDFQMSIFLKTKIINKNQKLEIEFIKIWGED